MFWMYVWFHSRKFIDVWEWSDRHSHLLEVLFLSLALPIIVFCITERRFKQVRNALSTRYIGPFPDHLNDIIEVVRGARKEITILADCVDYGSFRGLNLSKALVEEICARREEPRTVRFLVWGRWQTMSRANKFRDERLRLDRRFRCYVLYFLQSLLRYERPLVYEFYEEYRACGREILSGTTNWVRPPALIRMQSVLHFWFLYGKLKPAGIHPTMHYRPGNSLEDRVANVLRVLRRFVDQGREPTADEIAKEIGESEKESVSDPEVFFWIADDREAVFLLPRHGQDALAFRTSDYRLISALRDMFEEKMKAALAQAGDPSGTPDAIRAALRGSS